MKRLSAYELEYLEHPERFTFAYFRETKLDPHPAPVALSLADEELLNHYDNDYHHRTFHRTLFVPQLDTVGSAYQDLEDYPRATESLLVCLHDSAPGVRKQTVQALGNIGDSRARLDLVKLQSDPDRGVQKAVRKALKMLKGF